MPPHNNVATKKSGNCTTVNSGESETISLLSPPPHICIANKQKPITKQTSIDGYILVQQLGDSNKAIISVPPALTLCIFRLNTSVIQIKLSNAISK